jgi:endonuclease IV
VARTAGKAANIAIKKVKDIDSRYEVTRKAGQLLKEGFGKVKEVVDTIDEKN